MICGLPHVGRGDHELFRRELTIVQNRFAGIRRTGSAALDMAYVAAGRADAYWERGLFPWDIAAGIVLVREAGGFVSDCEGRDTFLTHGGLCCGNEAIHRELLACLKKS